VTGARVLVLTVVTVPVDARARRALVYIDLAFVACPAGLAVAPVAIDDVIAGAVLAWVALTLVNVCLAVGAGESWLASAPVSVDLVLAVTAVLTRVGRAFVDINVADFARPAGQTVAFVAVDLVLTVSMGAWR
jgi:hypothetical protein